MIPSNTALVLDLAIEAVSRVAAYGALLQQARAEGRDVSDAELDSLATQDDVARAKLQRDIEGAATATIKVPG